MARKGIGFLDKAGEELGDPSIRAGTSVMERPVTGLRSSRERIDASSRFLERSGGLRGSLSSFAAPGGEEESLAGDEKPLTSTAGLTPIFKGGQQIGLRGDKTTTELIKKPKTLSQSPSVDFGLPTDRLPTIEELGGALGNIAKYVSQLTKRNRARGLTPGVAVTKTRDRAGVGLTKAKLSTLAKLHETATLSGDKDKAEKIEAQLNALLQGDDAGAFDDDLAGDLAEIAGL